MKNKKKRGFTIAELIVAIAIVAIIGIPIFTVFLTSFNSFNLTSRASTAQSYASIALNYIINEISYAEYTTILTDYSPESGYNYIYVNNGVIYCDKDSVISEILREDMLDKENMTSAISFSSNGGKIIIVEIFIRDKTTNEAIFEIDKEIFVQNIPPGMTIGFSPGTVVEYTMPN